MKLINFEESSVKISLDKDELYIIQAIVGEIYSGVCVESSTTPFADVPDCQTTVPHATSPSRYG